MGDKNERMKRTKIEKRGSMMVTMFIIIFSSISLFVSSTLSLSVYIISHFRNPREKKNDERIVAVHHRFSSAAASLFPFRVPLRTRLANSVHGNLANALFVHFDLVTAQKVN